MPAIPNCCCSKGSAPYWYNPVFLICDIWALSEKMVRETSMVKCKAVKGSAVKGLNNETHQHSELTLQLP